SARVLHVRKSAEIASPQVWQRYLSPSKTKCLCGVARPHAGQKIETAPRRGSSALAAGSAVGSTGSMTSFLCIGCLGLGGPVALGVLGGQCFFLQPANFLDDLAQLVPE